MPERLGRRLGVALEPGSLVVRCRDDLDQPLERREVAARRGDEGLLDQVVAGDVDGVGPVHRRGVGTQRAPALHPRVDAREVQEQAAGGLRVATCGGAEAAEEHRVVDVVGPHEVEQVVGQARDGLVGDGGGEAELVAHASGPGGGVERSEASQRGGRDRHRLVLLVGQERQEGLGEAGEVPLRDDRLLTEGVAPGGVDRAEDRRGVEGVDEGAGAVVDGLAGDGHVVGVHHAVHEADQHPARHELGLGGHDRLEEGEVRLLGVCRPGVVAGDGVVGQAAQEVHVARRGGVLEAADAQVAARDPGQHRAGQQDLALDLRAGGDDPEGAGGRDPEGVHRHAHHVLAQHGPTAASPSPPREKGVRPDPLRCRSRRRPEVSVSSPSSRARPSPRRGDQPPNWWPA